MKSLAHSLVLSLAFVSPWSLAAAPDPALIGCWRAQKIVQYFKDGGSAADSSGRCSLHFTEDQLTSTCASASGTVTSTYHYRIERPNVYSATMAGSTFRTSLIGSTREFEYHVDGDRLATTTTMQTTDSAPATATIRVGTDAVKMPCP